MGTLSSNHTHIYFCWDKARGTRVTCPEKKKAKYNTWNRSSQECSQGPQQQFSISGRPDKQGEIWDYPHLPRVRETWVEPVSWFAQDQSSRGPIRRVGSTVQKNTVLPRAQREGDLQREPPSVYSARYGLVCAIQLLPGAEARERSPKGRYRLKNARMSSRAGH